MAAPEARRRHRHAPAGFTLIELVVVVVVLGVIAAVVVVSLRGSTPKAQAGACAIERRSLRESLGNFRAQRDRDPTAAEGFGLLVDDGFLATAPASSSWLYDGAGDVIGVGPCAGTTKGPTTPTATGPVTVFAATSLTNAFNDLKAKLAAVAPGLSITYSFAGSNALKAQINTGSSPADVFAAADTLNAPSAPLVASSQLFATNKLAIVTRPGNPAGVSGLADLFTSGKQVVLCQTGVPCGTAANTAFATLGKTRADLGANFVSETANVGLVVTAVAGGAPDTVGVVYTTDAAAAGGSVGTVAIPDANNAVNHYPVYRISSGSHSTAAQQFIAYLLGPEGRAILAARGFGPP